MNLQLLYSHSATFYHSTLYQIISQSLDKSYTVHKHTSVANSICVIFDDRSTKEGSVSSKFIKQKAPWFIFLFQETQRKDQCPTAHKERLLGSSSRCSKKGAVSYKSTERLSASSSYYKPRNLTPNP